MPDSKFSEKTVLPVSLIATILSLVGFGAWGMSAMHSDIAKGKAELADVRADQKEVVRQLSAINETLYQIKAVLKEK